MNSQQDKIKIKSLAELGEAFEKTKNESEEEANLTQVKDFARKEFMTYRIVSVFGYLIGVHKSIFENENEGLDIEVYNELNETKEYRIIRCLCMLRTAFEQRYNKINNAFYMDMKNINSLPEMIPQDAYQQLMNDGITLYKTNPKCDDYIILINNELSNRIGSAKTAFPEWISWQYIKPLFIMPDGLKPQEIKKEGMNFSVNRKNYPYGVYLNWNAISKTQESLGNILYNDEKFVTLLYSRNNDRFEDMSLISKAGRKTTQNLLNFLKRSTNCLIAVDCDNSEPVKLAAAISSMNSEYVCNIKKILLFDSENNTKQWQTVTDKYLHIAMPEVEIEHIVLKRINQNKSQVDIALAIRTSEEIWKTGIDSVVLFSSDCDYWTMIQMHQVPFFVMLEQEKAGANMIKTLNENQVPFCFIDEFYTGAAYSIKTETIRDTIQERLDNTMSGLNLDRMLNLITHDSWIRMTDKERAVLYKRLHDGLRLTIDKEGNIRLVFD